MRDFFVKEFYHISILASCGSIIENELIEIKDNAQVKELVLALKACSFIIGPNEGSLIYSYNENVLDEMSSILVETMFSLLDSKEIETFPYYLFKLTEKYINNLIERFNKKGHGDKTANGNQKEWLISFLPHHYSRKNLFIFYYEIISNMVEDINNLRGWNVIRDYYKKKIKPNSINEIKVPITFLSYAFKDNIYALFLFNVFKYGGGFLYVDSLFGEEHKNKNNDDDGEEIKKALTPWIDKADQILFLHSIHSNRAKTQLSSWCSWELGYSYKTKDAKKYFKMVVFGIDEAYSHPIIDNSFEEYIYVENGIINKNFNKQNKTEQEMKASICADFMFRYR